jgi:hypothetical protein
VYPSSFAAWALHQRALPILRTTNVTAEAGVKKPITPFAHGVIDYATSAALMSAPRLMKFPDNAARAAYALAMGYTALSAMTDYPLSAKKVVPFKAHGAAELAIGAALPMVPWMLGFSEHRAARNLFIGLAGFSMVVAMLTDWEKKSERVARRQHRRRPRLVAA